MRGAAKGSLEANVMVPRAAGDTTAVAIPRKLPDGVVANTPFWGTKNATAEYQAVKRKHEKYAQRRWTRDVLMLGRLTDLVLSGRLNGWLGVA